MPIISQPLASARDQHSQLTTVLLLLNKYFVRDPKIAQKKAKSPLEMGSYKKGFCRNGHAFWQCACNRRDQKKLMDVFPLAKTNLLEGFIIDYIRP